MSPLQGKTLFLCALAAGLFSVAPVRAEPSYVAAVGYGQDGPLLKVVQITNPGGTPSAVQAEVSLADDFGAVHDVAWLPTGAGGPRRFAVLGDCNDFIPPETYCPCSGQWSGTTHRLTGEVVFFDVVPGPGLARAGQATLDHTFTRTWESLATQHNPNSLRVYHLASLVSGGFLIQAASNGVNTFGNPTDSNYDRIIVFDSAAAQRFGSDGLNGWYTGHLDVCGLAGAGADRFINCWDLAPRAGGAGPGYLARYRVDWAGGRLVTEASLGGDFGTDCYYMSQVAPLAALPPHVVGGGLLINNYRLDSYNAPPDFPTLGQLEISYGWGHAGLDNIDEVLGISSDDGSLYAMLRRGGTNYELYALNGADGSYVSRSYTFTWGGTEWALVASDGDAMSFVPEYCPRLGDINADGLVNGDDIGGFVRAKLGEAPLPGEMHICANYMTGSLEGDMAAFATDLLGS